MRADIALFISTIAAIAIVGLLVRNASGTTGIIRETGDAYSQILGVAISANPQFAERSHKVS